MKFYHKLCNVLFFILITIISPQCFSQPTVTMPNNFTKHPPFKLNRIAKLTNDKICIYNSQSPNYMITMSSQYSDKYHYNLAYKNHTIKYYLYLCQSNCRTQCKVLLNNRSYIFHDANTKNKQCHEGHRFCLKILVPKSSLLKAYARKPYSDRIAITIASVS